MIILKQIQIPSKEHDTNLQEVKKLLAKIKKTLIIPEAKILKIKQFTNQYHEMNNHEDELLNLGIKKDTLKAGRYSLMKKINDEITDLFPNDIVYESMQATQRYYLDSIEISICKGLSNSAKRYEDTNMYYIISERSDNWYKYKKTISVFYAIEPCENYPLTCGVIQLYYLQLTYSFICYDEEI
ncbi:MAG: hypothetical protein HFG28_16220 [Eubacterium sp.]|nr:hypothetical protein [Eubacterium sp.]